MVRRAWCAFWHEEAQLDDTETAEKRNNIVLREHPHKIVEIPRQNLIKASAYEEMLGSIVEILTRQQKNNITALRMSRPGGAGVAQRNRGRVYPLVGPPRALRARPSKWTQSAAPLSPTAKRSDSTPASAASREGVGWTQCWAADYASLQTSRYVVFQL